MSLLLCLESHLCIRILCCSYLSKRRITAVVNDATFKSEDLNILINE